VTMKLCVYRVYFHQITTGPDSKEVSHTSPEMKMCAAENQGQLLDTLPEPKQGPAGTTTRNVIVQIDQRHKDVLYNERK
jgi:hypothetical protein